MNKNCNENYKELIKTDISNDVSVLYNNNSDIDIYVINLKHRIDRLENVKKQFNDKKNVNEKQFSRLS
jgi:hypothetical protein